jgi:hypothetical protein
MGDGGPPPACNVQFATGCACKVNVGMVTLTAGGDSAQLAPSEEKVAQRVSQVPQP